MDTDNAKKSSGKGKKAPDVGKDKGNEVNTGIKRPRADDDDDDDGAGLMSAGASSTFELPWDFSMPAPPDIVTDPVAREWHDVAMESDVD